MRFPSTTIEVIGTQSRVTLDAVIDTAFEGELALPLRTALSLGLVLAAETPIGLANATTSWEFVLSGEAVFLGERRPVSIFVFDRDEALIGTHMLDDCQLVVDFVEKKVNLFRQKTKKSKKN